MTLILVILIVLVAVVLSFIVLVQNPKGGGLTGNIAGFSNQFMGVKQTTDVLEKGTWIFGAAIAILCLTSSLFISGKSAASTSEATQKADPSSSGANRPASGGNTNNQATFPGTNPAAPQK